MAQDKKEPRQLFYDHFQAGYGMLGFAFVFFLLTIPALRGLESYKWAFFPLFGGLVFIILNFIVCRVQIDRAYIHIIFGAGLLYFRYPVANITAARYFPLAFTDLIGIRKTAHFRLFRVSGNHAVEVSFLHIPIPVRIGTDDPEGLLEGIRQARLAAGANLNPVDAGGALAAS